MKQVGTRFNPWVLPFLGGVLLVAASSARADEVDRIREKCGELARAIISERYDHLAEAKDSSLGRVYKDFDYLLKDSKTSILADATKSASDPAQKHRLERLHEFLMGERIFYAVAPNWDTAESYARSASMAVSGSDVELNLNSFEQMLANADNRSNRRIWYLASRDLRENANVFKLNLYLDLDRKAQELVGTDYDTFLATRYEIDPAALEALCQQVLDSTQEEYQQLLQAVVPVAIDGMTVEDLREYDVPYLLRMHQLDDTFEDGKYENVAGKWLKDFGLDLKNARKLRISDESRIGKSPEPWTFPIANGEDTRISINPLGGFPDYWNLFGQLGSAYFYYNIDANLPLSDQRFGSPVLPMTYAALFQSVLLRPEWRDKYLKVKEPQQVDEAVRLRSLFDLREAAARYLFYRKMYSDSETPPSAYTEMMQSAMTWNQGATEEANYLLADDMHKSGMRVLASIRAAQLQGSLSTQFGETWWSSPEAGKWLKSQWGKGFSVPASDVWQAWGLGAADAAALAH